MRKYWLLLSDRFNALADRERMIVFLSLAGLLCAIAYLGFIEPMQSKRLRYQAKIKQQSTALQALQAQEQLLLQQSLQDPDAARQQQISTIEQENRDRRAELARLQQALAAPERMPRLLADLLDRNSGLELISIKTLPAENLLPQQAETGAAPGAIGKPGQVMTGIGVIGLQVGASADAGAASAASASTAGAKAAPRGVYRHGLQMVVRGSWPALSAYVHKIEQLPWRFYWGDLRYVVDRYPQAELSFTVYTVSLDQAWLSL